VGAEGETIVVNADGAQFHAARVDLDHPCPKVTIDIRVVHVLVYRETENVWVVQAHGGVLGPDVRDDAVVSWEGLEIVAVDGADHVLGRHLVHPEGP
jgi:hypothetical protein